MTPKMLDLMEMTIDGRMPQPPAAQLLGFLLTSARGSGEAVVELTVTDRHTNPMGIVQGGILAAVVDAAMGWAYAARLADGESFTTLELKINYLKAVRTGNLRALGKVVHAGRTVGLVEGEVRDEKDQLVARASSTCMTVRA